MIVRAKFTVIGVMDRGNAARTIHMAPNYDASIPEDQRFFQYTPTGKLEMYVTNPAVIAAMPVGKAFYLDFTPVPE